ncbi:MAG: UDP-N-acetylmuramoyl-L-alanine--D-glutamate ligase [Phycisphaerales bacterium]|jgi:UDP-N-acetylmuramoylalanine--D-glutamate ligase|nr:UDP-N-acetylmuramoyl-L-alanine--D-glutamate ligase [Phycisphaerales bacterium]MBT7171805.1 UDP-N-acetylmuramoyl-L-alanine--D-glutamate ligase [Phycisphaerales bacterium]
MQTTDDLLRGMRVTVVGLGRFGGGVGAANFLASRGAKVTVSDQADEEILSESVAQLTDDSISLALGGHRECDFFDTELLVVNPAFPKTHPLLVEATRRGVPRTSEINLFLERCPADMVGITGSVGKSTTVSMCGEVLSRRYRTHVGGNIGRSLLGDLEQIGPEDIVVLELSSFQLEDIPLVGVSPRVGLVTNLIPNHLDRHGTMEAYASAKQNLLRYRAQRGVTLLNAAAPELADWPAVAGGRVEWYNLPDDEPFDLRVPGDHNQANAQAAWAVGRALGIERHDAEDALKNFHGLAHRLELVADHDGVQYFNDSKCTTPRGAEVALTAFEPETAVILLGGYDKGATWDELGREVSKRAKRAVCFGQTGPAIAEAIRTAGMEPFTADTLDEAFALAQREAADGDTVLLSPACASWDQFTNYEERGERFTQLAKG